MRKRIRQAALLQGVAPARVWSVRFDDTTSSPVGVRADLARGLVAEVAVGNATILIIFPFLTARFSMPLGMKARADGVILSDGVRRALR